MPDQAMDKETKAPATHAATPDIPSTPEGCTPPPLSHFIPHYETASSKTCSNCGGPPSQRCAGCAEGVDKRGNHAPTFYCSKECQKKHWKGAHKTACKAANERKQLFRAGQILQAVFNASRRLTWYDKIEEVKWRTEAGEKRLMVRVDNFRNVGELAPFPDKLIPDEQAKQVLLTHRVGLEAVMTMSDLVKNLLEGTGAETMECGVFVKAPTVAQSNIDSERHQHWFFRIILSSGEWYTLDLCRSQFAFASGIEGVASVIPYWEHLLNLDEDSDLLDLPLRYHLGTCELRRNELEASKTVTSVEQVHPNDVLALIRHQVFVIIKYVQETWPAKTTQTDHQDLPSILRVDFSTYQELFCKFVWILEIAMRKLRNEINSGRLIMTVKGLRLQHDTETNNASESGTS